MRSAIDKRASGRWRARYYAEGKWFPRTFDLEREAKAWLNEVAAKFEAGGWTSPTAGKTLFGDWVEEFWRSQNHLAPRSRHTQRALCRVHILPKWADRQLHSITVRQVVVWSSELPSSTPKGLTPNTCKAVYNIFSKIMRGAVEAQLLSAPPLPPKRKHLPRIRKTVVRVLTADEVSALASAIDPRYRALILCMAYGGFRIGEMFALRLGKIDFQAGTVRIDDTQTEISGHLFYGNGTKTENSLRTVKLPSAVVEELAEHVVRFVSDPTDSRSLVFTGRRGGDLRQTGFRKFAWASAVAAGDLAPLHPHELRHTAVSTWIAEGATAPVVAARAGDAISTVMGVYAHLFPADEDRLLAALDVRFRAAEATGTDGTITTFDPTRRRRGSRTA